MKKKIMIPNTDLEISWIGLGTAKAGISYEGREVDELISTYLSYGGNLIDTARVYSDWIPGEKGRSERVLGESIRRLGIRDEIVLMTKGGHPDLSVQHSDMHRARMRAADMRSDLELSLQALQTDVIDIYFYHRDDPQQSVAELIETMEAFRRKGKIRYYACSNWSPERMQEADAYCAGKGYRGLVADESLLNPGTLHMNPPYDDTLAVAGEENLQYHQHRPENILMPYSSVAEGYFHHLLQKGPVFQEIRHEII